MDLPLLKMANSSYQNIYHILKKKIDKNGLFVFLKQFEEIYQYRTN